jgi:hypothetical protein
MFARILTLAVLGAMTLTVVGCDGDGSNVASVAIQNDFNNPAMSYQPPWTICEASYGGVDFGKIDIGTTSAEMEVTAGLDYVYMVAAWDDPTCDPAHALPLATPNEEEVVPGQHRTIVINMANHQGPCPPEGVQPMGEVQYEHVRSLWPQYDFQPYADRTLNRQCTQ